MGFSFANVRQATKTRRRRQSPRFTMNTAHVLTSEGDLHLSQDVPFVLAGADRAPCISCVRRWRSPHAVDLRMQSKRSLRRLACERQSRRHQQRAAQRCHKSTPRTQQDCPSSNPQGSVPDAAARPSSFIASVFWLLALFAAAIAAACTACGRTAAAAAATAAFLPVRVKEDSPFDGRADGRAVVVGMRVPHKDQWRRSTLAHPLLSRSVCLAARPTLPEQGARRALHV